jgi:hypothetical protein
MAARWEHARVEFILKHLGLVQHKKAFKNFVREKKNDGLFTCELFLAAFPAFPLLLGTSTLPMIHEPLHRCEKAFHPEWFRNFMKLPFMEAYSELHDKYGDRTESAAVGLVFPRKGFPQGLLVHNGDLATFVPPNSSAHTYYGSGPVGMTITVQPFVGWLTKVKSQVELVPSF